MGWFSWWKKNGKDSQDDASEKRESQAQTFDTFVEATGGGWSEPPEVIATDGGNQASYVERQLELARQQAESESVQVGEEFEYRLTNLPMMEFPHETMLGLMTQAHKYGLSVKLMADVMVTFIRVE